MKSLPYKILSKEPVLLGAAVLAVFGAAAPDASAAWKGAAVAVVAWGVRALSTPESKVKARVDQAAVAARHEALADVASLQPSEKPKRPPRARGVKKAPAPARR